MVIKKAGRPKGACNAATLKRRIEVESMLSRRISQIEICDTLSAQFKVAPRVIKKDCQEVRLKWMAQLKDETEGARETYLASLLQLRARAWDGVPVEGPEGVERLTMRDNRIVLECEREIAKLTGAIPDSHGTNVNIQIQEAEALVKNVVQVVFSVVKDGTARDQIKQEMKKLLAPGSNNGGENGS